MADDDYYDKLLALPVRYIFLDCETTDLNPDVDEITEIAWYTERDGREFVREWAVKHTQLAGDWVVKETDYITRLVPAPKVDLEVCLQTLMQDCNGAHAFLVAQNPTFDHAFLRKAFYKRGLRVPYDYHLISVEILVMQALGLERPPRIKDQRRLLGLEGEREVKHAAQPDAAEVKLIFNACRARSLAAV